MRSPSPNLAISHPAAMTLTELLFVLTLIGILSFLVIPVVAAGKSAADGARCVANLRSLGLATLTYATENQGQLPPGRTWDVSIKPFLGEYPNASSSPFRCPIDRRPNVPLHSIRSYTANGIDPNRPGKGVFSSRAGTVSRRLSELAYPAATVLYSEYFTRLAGVPLANNVGDISYSWMLGFEGTGNFPRLKSGACYHGDSMAFVFADGHSKLVDPRMIPEGAKSPWNAYPPSR
jgi:prepilin-type processing-associated H-X9-DG protein